MAELLSSLWSDLRYGARMLRRNPGFSIAAILTLALGIGANTAIFTITNAVLLRSLPYRDPGQLVALDAQQKDHQSRCCTLNWSDLIRSRNQSFSATAVAAIDTFNLTGRGEPQQVAAGRVSPGFFEMLGVPMQLGRTFAQDEGQPAGKFVVIISNSLWRNRFGSDAHVVGQTLNLDTTAYTVVGVLPAGMQFPFLGQADVWTPRYFEHSLFTPQRLRMGVGYLSLIGRLRDGVSRERALAEVQLLHEQYRKENPTAPDADPDVSAVVTNLQDSVVANIRTRLLFLSVFVALVLLIACANVASLLLSRALARKKEIAVRAALGARRRLIVRQLLMESVLLAVIAGAIGLGISYAATRWLGTLIQDNLPQGMPIAIDSGVLVFTLAVSIFTGVIFGIFPALQLARTDLNSALRDEGRGSTAGYGHVQMRSVFARGTARVYLRDLLVVGQVALSLLLLIGAGLLVRSFKHLLNVDPGFESQNVLTMNINLPTVKYADAQKQISFFDELVRRVSALPGVRSAAISAALPLTFKRITPVLPEGQPEVPLAQRPFLDIEAVSPGWFETMRVPLRGGRDFTAADNLQGHKVAIVNETFARRFWPNENPIGKHVVVGRWPEPAEVIAMAADVKNNGLAQDTRPQLYLAFPQLAWGNMNMLVRTATNPHNMISPVRAQIAGLDPDQPVTNILTVDELMDGSRAQPRFTVLLLGIFSGTALVLAVVGIYGVLSYTVTQRRQELGIRLALGAEKSDILSLVVGRGMLLTVVGIVFGLITAMITTHLMSTLLYKVSALDVTTFVLTPLAFIVIGALASYVPARRAAKVDPTEALRGN